tara:strand:- start:852 stop:1124 length:273 start_codon:yes stop_codon:yes gene_type:complete
MSDHHRSIQNKVAAAAVLEIMDIRGADPHMRDPYQGLTRQEGTLERVRLYTQIIHSVKDSGLIVGVGIGSGGCHFIAFAALCPRYPRYPR